MRLRCPRLSVYLQFARIALTQVLLDPVRRHIRCTPVAVRATNVFDQVATGSYPPVAPTDPDLPHSGIKCG